jgi:hypothetical protein
MSGMDTTGQARRLRTRIRGHLPAKLAVALTAAALALPAAAAGYTVPGDPTGGGQSAATADTSGLVLHRDGSKAVPFVAEVGAQDVAAGGTATAGGFDWGDAFIGAGAALGIAAIGGIGLTIRRRGIVHADSVLSES